MGKRGPKPRGKVKIKWSPDFAYAIGLIATDGCLSKSGRHTDLTSKDLEQLTNFLKALRIDSSIGYKFSGVRREKYGRVQIGDVLFYQFLISIGLTSNKSKTLGEIDIPSRYFFDFLRGCFDGDGCTYSYWDKRWRSSFMYYLEFVSASKVHIDWLRAELHKRLQVKGHITGGGRGTIFQLKYAKREALIIVKKMYYSKTVICLSRKRKKIEIMLEEANYLTK